MKGNVLPQLTWRWIKVNEVASGELPEKKAYTAVSGVSGDFGAKREEEFAKSGHGFSDEMLAWNAEHANFENYWEIKQGDFLRLDLPLSAENPDLVDKQRIVTPQAQCGIALISVDSVDEAEAHRNGTIYVDVEEDGRLQLILLHRLNEKSTSDLSIIARIGDGGHLHLTHVELGAGRANINYGCDLVGFEAQTTVSCAYIAGGEEKIDLFYDIRHVGEETTSDIQVNGALMDRARKSFRGTIDFKQGACGAVGNEEEFAILLDEDVHSIAVPLLLCHEDDVIGNHAASAGRLDEEMLFYLMSRGFDREEAKGLIIEARMTPTIDRIPDEELRAELREQLHERIVR